ncbi:hypothetical protein H9W90_09755 [Polaribacter pectinis]|uniref:Uncharacterized protein n=1 Tax=Polaribacter pectinis TaxID=2738844 RepID=A0A7G9L781_9FLAO|nr:hypothetical protein [Polaribacter pectinis]QNM84480.1 hypothetical protein H9W90_09755 [Polaribacter pectinis]
MKQHKKAGLAGTTLVFIFFISGLYHIIRISKGFSFKESFLPELINLISTQVPLIIPAIVLLLIKDFKQKYIFSVWLYPIILALGLINVFLSNDALAAGLPMIVIVFPACILLAIIYFFLRERQ